MRQRAWIFRAGGLACLLVGLAAAVAGVAAYPDNTSPFLSRKGAGSTAEAGEYYAQIGAPVTFADWYAQYFPNTGQVASANYYNAGDLGFGREMHCRQSGVIVACYVANHGLGAAAPPDLAVQDAVDNTRLLPTVAMVYDFNLDGQPNDVKFYVYAPDGSRLNQVALDSEGAKNVPNLCLACHGGSYNSSNAGPNPNSVTGANFLPWDLDSFVYSNSPGQTKAAQLEQFRILNSFVLFTNPNPKITQLIDGWYGGPGGVANPSALYNDSYIPPGWDVSPDSRELYVKVIKHYCRGCHMAQTTNLEGPADLSSAFYPVFEANDMPHAQVTSHKFWAGDGPISLARYGFPTETFVVTQSGDTVPDGCTAYCTLREAVIAANADPDHSVIVFAAPSAILLARSGANEDLANTGDLDITEDVTILGYGAGQTIISGAGLDRVFHIQNGAQVVIQRLTVSNGSASLGGGILVDYNSRLTLNLSVVRNNTGTTSGFTGNGLAVRSGATLAINQSSVVNNLGSGGSGGGLLNDEGTLLLDNVTISGNTAGAGAGIYTSYLGATTLRHVTVVANTASTAGGGLVIMGGATLTMTSSLLAGNSAPADPNCQEDSATFTSLGYNLVGLLNFAAGGCGTAGTDSYLLSTLDTAVGPLGIEPTNFLYIHRPTVNSPVVDAIPLGASCAPPSYDARDLPRPRDGDSDGTLGCDIGAIEKATREVYLPLTVR